MVVEQFPWVHFYQKVSIFLENLRLTTHIIPGRNRVSEKSSREKISPEPLESFVDSKIPKRNLALMPLRCEALLEHFSMCRRAWVLPKNNEISLGKRDGT